MLILMAQVGHNAIKSICRALREWSERVGKPKRTDLVRSLPTEVTDLVRDHYTEAIDNALRSNGGRNAEHPVLSTIEQDLKTK